jgi:pullulanase
MRKTRKSASLLFVLCGLVLAGCNTGSNVSSQTTSSSDATCSEENLATSLTDQTTKDVSLPNLPTSFSVQTVVFHYRRSDATYTGWKLWLWVGSAAGADFQFNYQDNFGVAAAYPLSSFTGAQTSGISFIVKKGEWEAKDPDGDRKASIAGLTQSSGAYNLYLMSGDSSIYTTPTLSQNDEIKKATFKDSKTITFETNLKVSHYSVKENGTEIAKGDVCAKEGTISLSNSADVSKQYTLELTFVSSGSKVSIPVATNVLYNTDSFNNAYYFDGELGAIYTTEKTTFKVWSPFSTSISLNLYSAGSATETGGASAYATKAMEKGEKGVWSTEVSGDLEGKYYTYTVSNSTYTNKEIVDPYAKSAGANGVRGMIVDFSKTNPDGWNDISALQIDRKALTVYEMHVADLTSSSTWNGSETKRKKFLGLCETGTTYATSSYDGGASHPTGFDHLKYLGVNAVQLQPIFDQANDELNPVFNWGYNPLNYNCLDGIFSSNPNDGYARIKEFKTVVKAYHDAGINIIMDVVYNHMASAVGSNFDVLMPGYYFRYDVNGNLSNGSGCGNETASDNKMFRKFMIDSTDFWAKEYKLGGFRFDLMGLHDIETMNQVTASLKTINPSICVYGEPWTGGTTTLDNSKQAKQLNGNSFVGYGQFNDQMRDGLIKGGLHNKTEQGWVTNENSISSTDVETILAGIKGITQTPTGTSSSYAVTIADPDKTVNYVTCHDNYTLYDRVVEAGASSRKVIEPMDVLANSVVFTSQGTSFMQGGEEFLRTKGGNSNSYDADYSVNTFDYNRVCKYSSTVDNYKKLIALKQNFSGLHLGRTGISSIDVQSLDGGQVISYSLSGKLNNENKIFKIYHVNGLGTTSLSNIDLTGYSLYLDTLGNNRSGSFKPDKFETIIAEKDA